MKLPNLILISMAATAALAEQGNLSQIEKLALENNHHVGFATHQVAVADADAEGLLSPFKPRVSLNAYAAGGEGSMIFPSMVPPVNYAALPDGGSILANVMVSWRIWTNGQDKATADVAEAKRAYAAQYDRAAKLGAVRDVRRSFAEYLHQAEQLKAAQAEDKRAKQVLADTREMVAKGKLAEAFVYRAEAEAARVAGRLEQIGAKLSTAHSMISKTTGVPVESIGDWDVDLIAPDNLEDALVAAGKMRPEISLWRALQTQKLDEAELAERSRGPELSFMLMGAGGDRRDPMAKAGLVFSWAFEDGGARRAKAKKMLAEANAADHHALGAMMDAASETASAWASWKAAPSTVNAAERSVKASDEFYKIERVRFNAGKGTLSELLEAQEMLAESEALLASAIWRQRLAWTNLMAAVGILNWDEINAEKELNSAFLSLSKEQVAP